jgi:hypothetical protein
MRMRGIERARRRLPQSLSLHPYPLGANEYSMPERSLSQRLNQRSRRAGLMIGLTMGLTIAVCAGSFAVIYAALDPLTSDFVTRGNTSQIETPAQAAAQTGTEGPAQPAQNQPQQPTPTPPPTSPPATPPADAFTPDYQIAFTSVNLRSEPAATGGQDTVVRTLAPGTPLQYLNQDDPSADAAPSERWMRFRTEEGDEGWVREIDVETYEA